MRLSTRPPAHPDEFHGKVGKPRSTPNQDLVWLEAISSPDCQYTNNFLERTLNKLRECDPDAYTVLNAVYTGDHADPSLPEHWRREPNKVTNAVLEYLEDGMQWFTFWANRERAILYWPSPDEAKGYVDQQLKKRREARYHYYQAIEKGKKITEAVQIAALRASCSERAVYNWVKPKEEVES